MQRDTDDSTGRCGSGVGLGLLLQVSLLCAACVPGQWIGKRAQCFHPGIQSVDVTTDDSALVFSYCDKRHSYIGITGISGGKVSIVKGGDDQTLFNRVVLSPDDRSIFFIQRRSRDKSFVFSINTDGSSLQPITSGAPGTENIRDIVFSPDGQRIYYINSSVFRSYSPIATANPHDLDFYSMRPDGSGVSKLTNMKVYALTGMTLSHDEKLLFYSGGIIDTQSGQYMQAFPFEASPASGIVREDLVWTSNYPLSKVSGQNLIVLASGKAYSRNKHGLPSIRGYGLYLSDLNQRQLVAEVVWLPAYLDSPTLLNNEQSIVFIKNDSLRGASDWSELWRIGLDGGDLRKIDLVLP